MAVPRVSVFIASYNHRRFLPETLGSVLDQEGPELELVVIDDGSSDGSVDVLREFARRDPRVRWGQHDNGANLGVSATANRAIAQCRAPFLAWLGSDDLLTPGSLARRLEVLDRSPRAGLVYGRAIVLDELSSRRRMMGRDVNRRPGPLATLALANCIPGSTVMLRRDALNDVGPLNEAIVSSDHELWLRVAARWDVAFVPEALAHYRIHGDNLNAVLDLPADARRTVDTLEQVALWAGGAGVSRKEPALAALVALQLAYYRFVSGDREGAAGELQGLESGKSTARALDLWTWRLTSAPAGSSFVEWLTNDSAAGPLSAELSRQLQRLAPVFPSLWEAWRQRRNGNREEARRLFLAAAIRKPTLLRDPVVRRFALERVLPLSLLPRRRRKSP